MLNQFKVTRKKIYRNIFQKDTDSYPFTNFTNLVYQSTSNYITRYLLFSVHFIYVQNFNFSLLNTADISVF